MELCDKLDLQEITKEKVFPINYQSHIYLLIQDPTNRLYNEDVLRKLGGRLEYCMAAPYATATIVTRDIQPMAIARRAGQMDNAGNQAEDEEKLGDLEEVHSEIANVYSSILNAAIDSRASDIHIGAQGDKCVVKYRVDGELRKYTEFPIKSMERLKNIVTTQAGMPEPKEAQEPRDGKYQMDHDGRKVDFRINIINETHDMPHIVIRILDNSKIITLSQLGLNEEMQAKLKDLFRMTQGIILFVGPTGSGKSTSLYAGIDECKDDYKTKQVIMVEDPVEQIRENLLQVSVNDTAGASYETIMKAALRHDPDVIGVGEIRDASVAKIALQMSDTGHLVLTTLHCNSATSAFHRLHELGMTWSDMASTVAAVVSQRLVRRVCDHCAEEYMLPEDHYWRKMFNLGDGPIKLRRGTGCSACGKTGYYGRIAIAEMLLCKRAVRDAVEKGKTQFEIEDIARQGGFKNYLEDGVEKALSGMTTFSELEKFRRNIIE
jgi:type IV pilus assembly protein PilB